jgi:hypothetical protein
MSEETKYCKLRTKNAKMLRMYGDKLTFSEVMREMRTNGLHSEWQFSDRYGNISFSSTLSDGCNGARFKMIGYSHGYRWSTVLIAVTAEQEAVLFAKACEMADIHIGQYIVEAFIENIQEGLIQAGFGPNHIKYDKGAAFFSFISKRNIWKPSKTKMICNRAVAEVMLTVWPDMLGIWPHASRLGIVYGRTDQKRKRADPAQLTPDQLHYQADYYFNKEVA